MWGRSQPGEAPDYLIVGLGNPGSKYLLTRHNAGWWVLDLLAQRHAATGGFTRHQSSAQHCQIGTRRALLVRPQTFMNLSGDAVAAWLRQYPGVPWILVYDDTSLKPGELKLKRSGGDGGHNGVSSVIQRVRTQQFDRLKLGIGQPAHSAALPDYVLAEPSPAERELLQMATVKAADVLELVVGKGFDRASAFLSGGDMKQEERRKRRTAAAENDAVAQPSAADSAHDPDAGSGPL